MTRIIITAVLLTAASLAAAEPLPYPKPRDGQCSSGYYQSGGFCVPLSSTSREAVPKPKGAQCPSGWAQSGGTCEKIR
jgi:hypothetical protein